MGYRDTFPGHRTGTRKTTKLYPETYSTEGEEVGLKSRMEEICTSGSVRGLAVDSTRVGRQPYSTNYPFSSEEKGLVVPLFFPVSRFRTIGADRW